MNIVTGYTGTPHVNSNEAQALNQGIFGNGNYVLNVGSKFGATIVDANTITIEDGEGVMQGVQFRIAPGDTEDVNIESGTSGYNRIDLICARYTKNAVTGVEAVNLVVIQGTPNASTPSEPSYNTGDILDNDSPVDFPLYKVTLTGLVPTVTAQFGFSCTVIETGTSNGWHYHKYSDGTYEAWQNASITDDITTSKNGVYVSASGHYLTAPTFSTSITYGLACIDRNSDTDGVFVNRVHPFTNALIIILGAHASISSTLFYVTARIEGEWS